MSLFCRKGFEIQALQSPSGWYLGTVDDQGFPNCRVSTEYAQSESDAVNLEMDRQVGCIENEFCNRGLGCVIPMEG